MVGWNARAPRVMSLQRADGWVYSYPRGSGSTAVATGKPEAGERCPQRGAGGGTWGTGHCRDGAWFQLHQSHHPEVQGAPGLPIHPLQRSRGAGLS